jgi:TetR/AcrR family transcriptional repressor of nem operon
MPRASRREAEQHREDVVEAASRLFREHGVAGISVPALMAEAGLTHGGFYGHFKSKEALTAEACVRAFEEKREEYDELIARHDGDREALRQDFIARYTGKGHRDAFGLGCPAAALCGDVAREGPKSPLRASFAAGLNMMAEKMSALLSRRKRRFNREDALAQVAMLVGGLVLARATKGDAISEEILESVRSAFLKA